MSYRIYTQPLMEKSKNKSIKGEIIVNTETGHISTKSSDGKINSATKDIESGILTQKSLLTLANKLVTTLEDLLPLLKDKYDKESDKLDDFNVRVKDLEVLIDKMNKSLIDIWNINEDNSYKLWIYYTSIENMLKGFVYEIPELFAIGRNVNELTYMHELLDEYKNKLATEMTTMKKRYTTVKTNVDSRVDKVTYDAFRSKLIKDYAALKSNNKVQSIKFS